MDSTAYYWNDYKEVHTKFFLETFKTGVIIPWIEKTFKLKISEKRYVIETKSISKDLLEDTIYQSEDTYCELTESEINEDIQGKVNYFFRCG